MNLVDANVLLYAVNESEPRHGEANRWLDDALNGPDTVAFAWVALLAFVRLSTRVGLFPEPLPVEGAIATVKSWLARPNAVIVEPTARHVDVLTGLLVALGTGGNLVTDAHLAALSIEHRCTVITYDADFGRFAGVRWAPPGPAAVTG